jgi:hypothetical protein
MSDNQPTDDESIADPTIDKPNQSLLSFISTVLVIFFVFFTNKS